MAETKFVTKFFNPQTYKDQNGALHYRVSANYNQPLSGNKNYYTTQKFAV